MKVLSILASRPHFVKASVVSPSSRAAHIDEILVHTGQHYDLNIIIDGLAKIAKELPVALPVCHPTQNSLTDLDLIDKAGLSTLLTEPLGYLDMIDAEKNAELIITDWGGVQREAFFFHAPCVAPRNETEWVELIELGWNMVAPPIAAANVVVGKRQGLESKGLPGKSYGNGTCARQIADLLLWRGI